MEIKLKGLLRSYGTILAGLGILAVFCVLNPHAFMTVQNFINITRQISLLVIISLGVTLVMAVDEFDLSVGAAASFGGLLAAKLALGGTPVPAGFLAPLVMALGIGLLNGFLVTHFRVLSFITTLGTSTVISGLAYWLTNGASISVGLPPGFKFFSAVSLGPIPLLSAIMAVLVLVFWFVMEHMAFGRRLYAIGGNQAASEAAGLKVNLNKNLAYGICSVLAAFTGILMASRIGSATPTSGDGMLLSSYAAVFLGKTMFKNGFPNIWGTFVGAAILGILANGLTIMRAPTFLQDVLTGSIIVLAVVVPKLNKRSRLV
ncbi:MAG: ABC transporter permease [Spirochaetaceae bacterium]|jgi:ribose transport system permease protein|nr:ABC transporter permease [Spirochaetaceae bacterium]